jgi:hypothetical protein
VKILAPTGIRTPNIDCAILAHLDMTDRGGGDENVHPTKKISSSIFSQSVFRHKEGQAISRSPHSDRELFTL